MTPQSKEVAILGLGYLKRLVSGGAKDTPASDGKEFYAELQDKMEKRGFLASPKADPDYSTAESKLWSLVIQGCREASPGGLSGSQKHEIGRDKMLRAMPRAKATLVEWDSWGAQWVQPLLSDLDLVPDAKATATSLRSAFEAVKAEAKKRSPDDLQTVEPPRLTFDARSLRGYSPAQVALVTALSYYANSLTNRKESSMARFTAIKDALDRLPSAGSDRQTWEGWAAQEMPLVKKHLANPIARHSLSNKAAAAINSAKPTPEVVQPEEVLPAEKPVAAQPLVEVKPSPAPAALPVPPQMLFITRDDSERTFKPKKSAKAKKTETREAVVILSPPPKRTGKHATRDTMNDLKSELKKATGLRKELDAVKVAHKVETDAEAMRRQGVAREKLAKRLVEHVRHESNPTSREIIAHITGTPRYAKYLADAGWSEATLEKKVIPEIRRRMRKKGNKARVKQIRQGKSIVRAAMELD